jgi:hypothetical protein
MKRIHTIITDFAAILGWKHRKTPQLTVTQENFVKTWRSLITTATKTTYYNY